MISPAISLQTTDTNGAAGLLQQRNNVMSDTTASLFSSSHHTTSTHSRESSLETLSTNLASSLGFTSPPTPTRDESITTTIITSSSIKPKDASAGSCHESSTSLFPTVNPHIAAASASAAAAAAAAASRPTLWEVFLYSYCYHQQLPPLVKDDVFLAPAISDNDSVITMNSSSTSSVVDSGLATGISAPTPCLSPVTAPADFLCNHEPLFDGIEDLQQHQQHQQQQQQHQQQQTPDDSTCTRYLLGSTNNNNNSETMFDICEYESLHAPSPSPTFASDNDESLFDDDDDAVNTDDISGSTIASSVSSGSSSEADEYHCSTPPSLKRKLSLISQDDDYALPELAHRRPKTKPVAKRRAKRHPGRRSRQKTIIAPYHEQQDGGDYLSVFERLTRAGIDWCRYCGTTEGVNWRPGPWGKRTLCNKHGCDYKGYGIASRLPRLDLSAFANECLEDRKRPVVQQSCVVCQNPDSTLDNRLIPCEGGCSRAYHQLCRIPAITPSAYQDKQWCCSTLCRENRKRNKVGPYES